MDFACRRWLSSTLNSCGGIPGQTGEMRFDHILAVLGGISPRRAGESAAREAASNLLRAYQPVNEPDDYAQRTNGIQFHISAGGRGVDGGCGGGGEHHARRRNADGP